MKYFPDAMDVETKLGVGYAVAYVMGLGMVVIMVSGLVAAVFWVVFSWYGVFSLPFIVVIFVLIRYHLR